MRQTVYGSPFAKHDIRVHLKLNYWTNAINSHTTIQYFESVRKKIKCFEHLLSPFAYKLWDNGTLFYDIIFEWNVLCSCNWCEGDTIDRYEAKFKKCNNAIWQKKNLNVRRSYLFPFGLNKPWLHIVSLSYSWVLVKSVWLFLFIICVIECVTIKKCWEWIQTEPNCKNKR